MMMEESDVFRSLVFPQHGPTCGGVSSAATGRCAIISWYECSSRSVAWITPEGRVRQNNNIIVQWLLA